MTTLPTQYIPIIRKRFTITASKVERGIMVVLRVERKRRCKNGAIRYGLRYHGVADDYHAAKAIAWSEYLETWQAITCQYCQEHFVSHWRYWRHQRFMPLGGSWDKREQGDYECPVEAEYGQEEIPC